MFGAYVCILVTVTFLYLYNIYVGSQPPKKLFSGPWKKGHQGIPLSWICTKRGIFVVSQKVEGRNELEIEDSKRKTYKWNFLSLPLEFEIQVEKFLAMSYYILLASTAGSSVTRS